VLVRCDSGGQTHAFTAFCAQAGLQFAVTLNHSPALAEAIAGAGDRAWTAAVDDDGAPRENGHVVEVTDALDLSVWPKGSRAIVRRERPHPGAQLRLADTDGFRCQAIWSSPGSVDTGV